VDKQSNAIALNQPDLQHAPGLIGTNKHFYSLIKVPSDHRVVQRVYGVSLSHTVLERARHDGGLIPHVTFPEEGRQGNLMKREGCRSAPLNS
jgi:hypothetical protein